MRRAASGAALLVALGAAGCSTSHSLPHSPAPAVPPRACSIGVGPFADEDGVDFALDLRDQLRARGPCSRVVVVAGPDADGVDVVVTGQVRATLTPRPIPDGLNASSVVLGAGLGALIGGIIVIASTRSPSADSRGLVDPGTRRSYDGLHGLGTGLVAGGAAGTAVGAGLMAADTLALRDLAMKASVDADVVVSQGGRPIAQFTTHDQGTIRGRHPADRPEGRAMYAAHGPLYREAMSRILENVAARVGEAVAR